MLHGVIFSLSAFYPHSARPSSAHPTCSSMRNVGRQILDGELTQGFASDNVFFRAEESNILLAGFDRRGVIR
jgi:hypothetical protein